ncbi:MAG TPA: hypothetical protein VHU24_03200 [Solirubrobacterales bacterium]|nr:hypothetical protein [Solirubrobacterales bacterium]
MTALTVIHFFVLLLLVGGAIRTVQYLWPENKVVQAIGVIY